MKILKIGEYVPSIDKDVIYRCPHWGYDNRDSSSNVLYKTNTYKGIVKHKNRDFILFSDNTYSWMVLYSEFKRVFPDWEVEEYSIDNYSVF